MKQGCNFLKNQRGFSLIEVFVAMMILGGGIFVIANAWSGNFLRVRNARINNTAASLIERKMTEIEVMYTDKPIDQIKEEEDGDFGPMYPGYRWMMTSKEFEMPDLSALLISRDGGADQMLLTMIKALTEYVGKSIKEVSVTVAFKPKHGNEIRHTVTTYFVDYSKEITMGGVTSGGSSNTGGDAGEETK